MSETVIPRFMISFFNETKIVTNYFHESAWTEFHNRFRVQEQVVSSVYCVCCGWWNYRNERNVKRNKFHFYFRFLRHKNQMKVEQWNVLGSISLWKDKKFAWIYMSRCDDDCLALDSAVKNIIILQLYWLLGSCRWNECQQVIKTKKTITSDELKM